MWMANLGKHPNAHPLTLPPQQDIGRKLDEKARRQR